AVFRHEADVHQLQQVAALSEAEAVSGWNALVAAGIGAESHDETISFGHDVFRHVVLANVSQARRSYLHRRAYAVLSQHVSVPGDLGSSAGAEDDSSLTKIGPMQPQQLSDLIEQAAGGRL